MKTKPDQYLKTCRLLKLALKTLDQISIMPRQARARRVAGAASQFIRSLAEGDEF